MRTASPSFLASPGAHGAPYDLHLKAFHHRVTKGAERKHCIVNYATGAVNKVKLCALCGEMLLSTDRRVRRAHRDWPKNLTTRCARRALQPWFRYHNYVMAIMSALALSGDFGYV